MLLSFLKKKRSLNKSRKRNFRTRLTLEMLEQRTLFNMDFGPLSIDAEGEPFSPGTRDASNVLVGKSEDQRVPLSLNANVSTRGLANHNFKSANGDNRGDIIGFFGSQIWVASSDGARLTSTLWGGWSDAVIWDFSGVGDFNGDSKLDVIGLTENGQWWVGLSSGSGFIDQFWGSWGEQTYRDFLIGDFDGDGRDDIAARDSASHLLINYSTGISFTAVNAGIWNSNTVWLDSTVGDLNGDGRFDIVSRNESGQWIAFLGNTDRSLSPVTWGVWAPTLHWFDVEVGDVNGDGKDDIVGRTYYGQWWVARSSDTGSVSELWTTWSGFVLWDDVMLADVQGTGRKSLVGRTQYGDWWVGASDGTKFVNSQWTIWSDTPVWRDVNWTDIDGDGRADLIGRANGGWWVGRSTGSSFANSYVGAWAQVPWLNVSTNQSMTSNPIAKAPTSNYAAGFVTKEFNNALINRINDQIDTFTYAQSKAPQQLNFSTLITSQKKVRDELLAFNGNIDRIMSGSIKQIIDSSAEDYTTPQTLRNSDRFLLRLSPRDAVARTVAAKAIQGEGEGSITVDADWPRKVAIEYYTGLVQGVQQGTRKALDPVMDILSRFGPVGSAMGALIRLNVAGIFAGLDSGISIAAGRNAVVSDYRATYDVFKPFLPRQVVGLFERVYDSIQPNSSENRSSSRVTFDENARSSLTQLNPSISGTAAQQIDSNFAQFNAILLGRISPIISASPGSLTFNVPLGGPAPADQTITVTNSGDPASILSFTATASGTGIIASGSGQLAGATSAAVNVSVSGVGLAKGSYSGTVTIAGDVAGITPIIVPVTLNVVEPVIAVSPSSMTITVTQGQNEQSQTVTVSNHGSLGSVLSYSSRSALGYVQVTGSQNQLAPGQFDYLTVKTRATNLPVGTYTDYLYILDNNNGSNYQYVIITVNVQAPPLAVIGVGATDVYFTATQGGASPASQVVTISNVGASGSSLDWAASLPNNRYSLSGGVSPLNALTFTTATLSMNTSGLVAGPYLDTITINSTNDPRVASKTINVHTTITSGQSTPTWGAFESGSNGRSSDQLYSISSSQMAIRFWMQPFGLADRFIVSDENGNVYVNAQFSTEDFDESVPIQQQHPRSIDFTKPAGVTRLRVQVVPNSNTSTAWWYRGVTPGQLWY